MLNLPFSALIYVAVFMYPSLSPSLSKQAARMTDVSAFKTSISFSYFVDFLPGSEQSSVYVIYAPSGAFSGRESARLCASA